MPNDISPTYGDIPSTLNNTQEELILLGAQQDDFCWDLNELGGK